MDRSFFKKIIDFSVSFCVLLIIVWFLAIVALWLYFANKGAGIFFTQEHPGKYAKIFKDIKFKTMTDERDVNGNFFQTKDA